MLQRQPIKRFQAGEMSFRVYNNFMTSIIPETYIQVPFKVLYAEGDIDPMHVFDCQINMLKGLMSVANLELRKSKLTEQLTKHELRYLLGKTVAAAESLAAGLDKDKVVISSAMEQIVDVFVEKDFIFGKKHSIVGYKGVKRNLK